MNKKDVLMLCQFFYPEYITAAVLPHQTAIHLVEHDYTVDVICGYPKEYLNKGEKIRTREQNNGINIYRVKYMQLSRDNMFLRLINYFSFVLMMFFQLPKLRHYKTTIVYTNPPIIPIIAIIGKILFNTKIIYVSYDVYPEIAQYTGVIRNNSLSCKIMKMINKLLFKHVDKVIALSNEMKEFFLNNRSIFESKIEVIPNWAAEEVDLIPKYTHKAGTPLTISYLGNMGIPQDFDTLLNVINHPEIRNNPNYKFVFAGHGNRRNKIEQFIQDNEINNVKIYGFLQGEEYKELLEQTDLFILSLKEELNGLAVPSKFYTYLQMNKPIIAIIHDDSDIYKDIKRFHLGISETNGKVKEIVSKLNQFYESDSVYDNHEVYGLYYARNIQLNKYAAVVAELIEDQPTSLVNPNENNKRTVY